jgi:hypothetical protein
MFPKKTTSTATYLCKSSVMICAEIDLLTHAAAAPRISCLFAPVKKDKAARSRRVKTKRTAIDKPSACVPLLELAKRSSRYVGTMSRNRMISDTMVIAQAAMRLLS